MLIGEYHRSIEKNYRLTFPSKLRKNIGDKAIITRGLDSCIFIFPLSQWELVIKKINSLSMTKKKNREFSRFFFSGALEIIFDKQGRFTIPQNLVEYAQIKKECILIGLNNRIELWNKSIWQKNLDSSIEQFQRTNDEILDFDVSI